MDYRTSKEFVNMLSNLFTPCLNYRMATEIESLSQLLPKINLVVVEAYDADAKEAMHVKCIHYKLEEALSNTRTLILIHLLIRTKRGQSRTGQSNHSSPDKHSSTNNSSDHSSVGLGFRC